MTKRILMKGNEAIAESAIRAGLQGYFAYPITPQNEFAAYMATHMPELGRTFVQAESEVAAINMVYGAASTGARTMTSSSSPGIALMQEGLSYIAGAEVPCVVVNISRGGPGLGNIGPSQGDYNQVTRGGGNGDYQCIVYAPATVQEAVDLTYESFDIADKWLMPVFILGDGAIGQMAEPVTLPEPRSVGTPDRGWELTGANGRAPRSIKSLRLAEGTLKQHNWDLKKKYDEIEKTEVRYELTHDDADVLIVAFGTAARVAKNSVKALREKGIKAGLFRPITLWPFPYDALRQAAKSAGRVLVAEMNMGQMLFDVRLAVQDDDKVSFLGKPGGEAFGPEEIFDAAEKALGGERV